MKKIITLILSLIFASFNASFALSELYLIRNANQANIQPIVTEGYSTYQYQLTKYNPYFGKSLENNSDYAVVILQQNGENLYYYYNSNDNKKINKFILKELKRSGYDYEESMNANIIDVYDNLALDIMNNMDNSANRYSFEDPVPNTVKLNNQRPSKTSDPATLKGAVAQIASGTKLNVYLQNSINTANANKGDQVIAVLMKDLIYNGAVVFPQGSLVYGTLTKAVHA